MSTERLPVVVLVSGRGSNLQSILDAAGDDLPVEIRGVISNRPDAAALDRAAARGVPTAVLDHRSYAERAAFDDALARLIDAWTPGLVVLAGFMRVLTPGFVAHYRGRLMNIHPSLLPRFPGLHTHERALAAGVREHGATVHFVTPDLDGGPVILQARVPVLPGDTAGTLAARVLEQEHRIYPEAIRWFAGGRLELRGNTVLLDGEPLAPGAPAPSG